MWRKRIGREESRKWFSEKPTWMSRTHMAELLRTLLHPGRSPGVLRRSLGWREASLGIGSEAAVRVRFAPSPTGNLRACDATGQSPSCGARPQNVFRRTFSGGGREGGQRDPILQGQKQIQERKLFALSGISLCLLGCTISFVLFFTYSVNVY